MKLRMISIEKAKIMCVSMIAALTVAMLGLISVSADINAVNSGPINLLIEPNSNGTGYDSNTLNTDDYTCSFYSMPTYGNIEREGPYSLDVSKKGLLWNTSVLSRHPKMYSKMANTTDSVFLGKTSGKELFFSVYCQDGSDSAKFYLTKFRGEYRH